MLVFRDGRQAVNGPRLVDEFAASLRQISEVSSPRSNHITDALLRAGELECALADAGHPVAGALAQMTDHLAGWHIGDPAPVADLERRARALTIPGTLIISRPEGFAYYALHPLDFAQLAASLAQRAGRVAVVGIRSIGTTLSAVVAAAARQKGAEAQRITVRPTGHPWDRRLDLAPDEHGWVHHQAERQAEFWIVDEGPGLSGSSFLAVAEALLSAGVPRERITLLASSPPNLDSLRAPHAAARWMRFRSEFVRSELRAPKEAAIWVGGGAWRGIFLDGAEWPAVWPQFERAKFLSADHKTLFKFEGLGRFGAEVRERSQHLGEAGLGPAISEEQDGYSRYEVLNGKSLSAADVSRHVLEQIAAYCAWRFRNFPAEPRPGEELEHMIQTNAREGLDEEVDLPELLIARPAVVDGHMHPSEWQRGQDGRLLKLDGASHGDDHFFPGPTDIAWDLAGTIVEWQLSPAATENFLMSYRKASGDDAGTRLPGYLLAYNLFRLGYCTMAAESLRGTEEQMRFHREANRYRTIAAQPKQLESARF